MSDFDICPGPTEQSFKKMCIENPIKAMELMDELPPARLTFAAEIAGSVIEKQLILPKLLDLLNHGDASVREGVVYGISCFLPDNTIKQTFTSLLNSESSPGVRWALIDVLW